MDIGSRLNGDRNSFDEFVDILYYNLEAGPLEEMSLSFQKVYNYQFFVEEEKDCIFHRVGEGYPDTIFRGKSISKRALGHSG